MASRTLQLLDKYFEEILCALCMIVMSSSIMLQVILRYVFAAASAWVEEISIISMIGGVYFGASLAIRDKSHLRIVFFINMFPKRIKTLFIIISDILWSAFLIFLLVESIICVKLFFESHCILPGLGIEQRWPQLIIPVSLIVMLIRMIQVYLRWMLKKDKELV